MQNSAGATFDEEIGGAMGIDGIWLRDTGRDTAIVFVHGILSNSETAWRHAGGAWWPKLVGDEPALSAADVYTFAYRTEVFSGGYSIGDAVDALKENMRVDGVLARRRLVFVCHSMGGIVVRRYLVARQFDLIDRGIGIGLFLVASPSLGSTYADWMSSLAKAFGHSQFDGLRFIKGNPFLTDLDKDFKNLKESGRIAMRGKELVEDRFMVLPGWIRKQVVEPFSGAVYFGDSFKVPGSDHSSIAKPASAREIQHRLLVDFVVNDMALGSAAAASPGASTAMPSPSPATAVVPPAVALPPPSPPPLPPPAVQTREPDGTTSLAELLADLVSDDPLLALAAARVLAKADTHIEAIIERPGRSNERVPLAAVRLALRGKPAAAAALASRVLEGDSDWHRGAAAALDFDVSHRAQAAAVLGPALANSSKDRARLIYRAVGTLGAVEWGWTVRSHFEKLHEDEAGSYAGFAVEAMADLFRNARGQQDVDSASTLLTSVLQLDASRGTRGYSALSLRSALDGSTGDHASVLIDRWAPSQTPLLRSIAADALGDARIRRALPTLQRLLDDADPSVRRAASQALGAMESKAALDVLLKSAPDSDGVAFALYLIDDADEFERIGTAFLDDHRFVGWAVARAAGRRRAGTFAGRLREMLHSDTEMQRGAAMLALARLGEPGDRQRIEDGWIESTSSSFEKVMATLAMLVLSPSRYGELEAGLRRDLSDSHHFWQPARTDIVDVLEGIGVEAASRLAAAWKPFYAGYGAGPFSGGSSP